MKSISTAFVLTSVLLVATSSSGAAPASTAFVISNRQAQATPPSTALTAYRQTYQYQLDQRTGHLDPAQVPKDKKKILKRGGPTSKFNNGEVESISSTPISTWTPPPSSTTGGGGVEGEEASTLTTPTNNGVVVGGGEEEASSTLIPTPTIPASTPAPTPTTPAATPTKHKKKKKIDITPFLSNTVSKVRQKAKSKLQKTKSSFVQNVKSNIVEPVKSGMASAASSDKVVAPPMKPTVLSQPQPSQPTATKTKQEEKPPAAAPTMKEALYDNFVMKRVLSIGEAYSLIERILLCTTEETIRREFRSTTGSHVVEHVITHHESIVTDNDGRFKLDGKHYQIGKIPTGPAAASLFGMGGLKDLWYGNPAIKIEQDAYGIRSVRYWFLKNGLLPRYEVHAKRMIQELFAKELDVLGKKK